MSFLLFNQPTKNYRTFDPSTSTSSPRLNSTPLLAFAFSTSIQYSTTIDPLPPFNKVRPLRPLNFMSPRPPLPPLHSGRVAKKQRTGEKNSESFF